MAQNTKIEWADHTFIPWEGCQKVGPGCDHCYAETRNARFGGGVATNWGPGAPRRRTSASNWRKPLAWQAEAKRTGTRPRVFCASLADVFDNAVPSDWRSDLFELIDRTPDLDWLLLTKRIGNAAQMLRDDWERDCFPPNVWLGATVVNQDEADRDVPKLLAVPARVRFLSCEPLLGPVDLNRIHEECDGGLGHSWESCLNGKRFSPWVDIDEDPMIPGHPKIDWVIAGGESGPGARPMHPDWVRSLRDQCKDAGVPFFFKQWGDWQPRHSWGDRKMCAIDAKGGKIPDDVIPQDVGGQRFARVGKSKAGRLLEGLEHSEFPA